MLLEFSCSNYKAIKEKIVFSMVAGSDKSHQEELYEFDDYRVSRITSVYGANGAGKSTTINLILDQLKLDAGEIRILGKQNHSYLHKENIGVVFDECKFHSVLMMLEYK